MRLYIVLCSQETPPAQKSMVKADEDEAMTPPVVKTHDSVPVLPVQRAGL